MKILHFDASSCRTNISYFFIVSIDTLVTVCPGGGQQEHVSSAHMQVLKEIL